MKMCTRVAHSQSIVEIGERSKVSKDYEKNGAKYIMMPGNAIKRHPFVEQRTAALIEYAENSGINRIEPGDNTHDIGIITSSTSYQYVKEVFGNTVSVLKLGMVNPLPVNMIKEFAKSVNSLFVIEELDPIIETHCKNIGVDAIGKDMFSILGEFSQKTIAKSFGFDDKYNISLDTPIPRSPADDVRRMSSQRNVLCSCKKQTHGFRRYRMLHSWRSTAFERFGYDLVYGSICIGNSRL